MQRNAREHKSYVVTAPGKDVQTARLSYRVLARREGMSLVSIALDTGRTHQIRCQFAHRGWPLVGDRKYGAREVEGMEGIALWSNSITFHHPQDGRRLHFSSPPPDTWPWNAFAEPLL